MNENWQYQIRFKLPSALAEAARIGARDGAYKYVADVLERHNAVAICQFDAFAGYVAEAEEHGIENYPLYKWTKATIDDPEKKSKHLLSFAIHINGDEIYDQNLAEAIEQDLRPLLENGTLLALTKHDTNPAKNPQPPEHLR